MHATQWFWIVTVGFLLVVNLRGEETREGGGDGGEADTSKGTCHCLQVPYAGRIPAGYDLPKRVRQARRYVAEKTDLRSLILFEKGSRGRYKSYTEIRLPRELSESPISRAERKRALEGIVQRVLQSCRLKEDEDGWVSRKRFARSVAGLSGADYGMNGFAPHSEGRYMAEVLGLPTDCDARPIQHHCPGHGEVAERWIEFLDSLSDRAALSPDTLDQIRECVRQHRERAFGIIRDRDRCEHRFIRPSYYDIYGVHRYTAGLVPTYFEFTSDLCTLLPKDTWKLLAEVLRLAHLPVKVTEAQTMPASTQKLSSLGTRGSEASQQNTSGSPRARTSP